MNNTTEKLNFTTKLAYGAGDLGSAITAGILIFFLLFFLTNVAGIPPGLAGLVLAVGKIFDAINDPFVGIWSDRTRSPWGRRLPWMFWGAVPFGVFFVLQWLVPPLNLWSLFFYYVLVGILFNIAYTMVNLPYTALTPELTKDYNERTSLNSFRMSFSVGGSILSLILAGLVLQQYPEDPQKQYAVLGLVASLISVIAIFWCVLRVPERNSQPILSQSQKKILGKGLVVAGVGAIVYALIRSLLTGQINIIVIVAAIVGLEITVFGVTMIFSRLEPHLVSKERIDSTQTNLNDSLPIKQQLKIAFQNRPFLYVIGIYLCSALCVQLTGSILIYFVVNWMGLSPQSFPVVAIVVQGTALIMLFGWQKFSDRFGKKNTYFCGIFFFILSQFGLFFLQPGQIFWLYVLAVISGFGVSVSYLIPWSMLPDVIEVDELRTGSRREGIFYSFMVLAQKVCLALALFLVGIALQLAGFIQQIPGGEIPIQPPAALLAIRIVLGPFPTIVLLISLVLAYFYPITEEFHTQIRAQLLEKQKLNHPG
ncbi:MFS transporter [Gloeocapsa sp. PCC 73106]|uniref:MFS transporter n=1 Tax=Gloeocapsa sp. PCC 73106 TaxID=102232 RepID=UPI0002ACA52F|nr:MFS transporter [Gloeocapsa sp. PCC 73106]ELR96597.1 Na+/melibiose symporter-like transporter [Gloeocapsa sp. PCC 73106]